MTVIHRVTAIYRTVIYRFDCIFKTCYSKVNDQLLTPPPPPLALANRQIKFDVYGKRLTPKIKLLPSVFSSLYIRIKIFVFAVNSKRHFYFCMIYLRVT